MSEEPRQNLGRGLVDRKLVDSPSDFIAGRPKAALLFCLLRVVRFSFFPARVFAVMSTVSIYLVCDFSIVATCPLMQAARFAFCWCFIRFVFGCSQSFCLVIQSRTKGEGRSTAN